MLDELLKIQNENTEIFADGIVESALNFKDTKDMKYLFEYMERVELVLLENGIFLHEILDLLADLRK